MARGRLLFACLLTLVLAAPGWAQIVLPSFVGVWKPVVGHGALYLVEAQGRSAEQLEACVVAEEAHGYWLEMMSDANHTQTIMKLLLTSAGTQRVILKVTGKPTVEVPPDFVVGGGLPVDVKKTGRALGKENVTTPAGEFACERYELTGQEMEVWLSPTVSPYNLVKLKSPTFNMTLQKCLTGAKTRITETPQPLELP